MSNTKKPNFFILGAPKCGTTAMSEYLKDHSDIFFSEPKEPNYFTDFGKKKNGYISDEDYLDRCFRGSAGYTAVGEGSTRYLRSPESVPAILKFNPEARFIVMVRNPVGMFHSLYYQRVYEMKESAKTPQEAWNSQNQYIKTGKASEGAKSDPEALQYGQICSIGSQLERVYQHVPKERVLVSFFDDFKNNTRKEYKRVLDFLGVEDDGREEFPVRHKRKTANSKFLRNFIKKGGILKRKLGIKKSASNMPVIGKIISGSEDLPADFKEELLSYFEDEIYKLENLTGRDLSMWRKI